MYGVDSMPETAENVAEQFKIERQAQDKMAYESQVEQRLLKRRLL
jgi:acetyl-CoA C-acetyltransferase